MTLTIVLAVFEQKGIRASLIESKTQTVPEVSQSIGPESFTLSC